MPELTLHELGRHENNKLVSVVVPTYNDSDYLKPALESIANQTYKSVEIVIVDSSGVDRLENLAARTEGVIYVYQEPNGLAAARNKGIAASSGEVIGFLDADDSWHPEKLEQQIAEIEAGADIVYSDVYVVTDNGEQRRLSALPVTNPDDHHIEFLYDGGVPILTVIARRECFKHENFNEDLPAVEDRNLLARLFESFEPAKVSKPLAYYRQRQGSMSSDNELMYEAELASLEHLCEELPCVREHRERLVSLAKYKNGKRLLRNGDARKARECFIAAARSGLHDYRLAMLLAVSILPWGQQKALWYLEHVQERLS